MKLWKINISLVALIVSAVMLMCGISSYIAVQIKTRDMVKCNGTVISVETYESGTEIGVRYDAINKSQSAYVNSPNIKVNVGDKVKLAYSEDNSNDVIYIGDDIFKARALTIIGLIVILGGIVYGLLNIIAINKIHQVYGEVSEIVQVIGRDDTYYAVALGVNPINGSVIQGKSNEFNGNIKNKLSIGTPVIINIGRKKTANSFQITEEKKEVSSIGDEDNYT